MLGTGVLEAGVLEAGVLEGVIVEETTELEDTTGWYLSLKVPSTAYFIQVP